MDIQVLNEIASLARQASLSKVSASVSANAQLKGLKGNPVPAPENPVPSPLEGSPEQAQAPITPEISSVARAASAYSAAVGDGLNSDELSAIQDLAGRVRTAVSDFLSQPGLEQAENAATVVASNPEAVQDLTASVEQAVVATLNLPELEGGVSVNATPPNADVLEDIPAPEKFISVERITSGAEPNNPVQVVAASPALQNANPQSRVVENSVNPENAPATSSRDFTVTPASPALQNANAQSRVAENPVNATDAPATSSGDYTVTAASPALENTQARGNAHVETPVSRPDAVTSSQQEPVTHPETVTTNPQEVPVVVASPALQNANPQSRVVENSVNAANTPETSNRDFTVTPASPALQNANAQSRVVENLVNATDVPETSNGDFRVTPASPALQNANSQSRVVENLVNATDTPETPVSRPETVATNRQETPVVAASPALQNAQAQNAEVGNPVNIPAPSSVDQGQGSAGGQAQPIGPEGAIAPPAGASSRTAPDPSNFQASSGPSNSQPASVPQPGPVQTSDLFAQDNAAVNPENIRNVSELVNSVVDNEFASEAKKIFSQPKVIRTVADLADFILERLREIIAANQLQKQNQSSGEVGIS